MRLVAFLLAIAGLYAAEPPSILLHRVAGGFEMPLDIRFPPDKSGRMFVVEQRGRIRIIKNGTPLNGQFLDLRNKVSCCGERGLLGLAFSPAFAENRTFYVNYTDTQGNTVVSRMRLGGNPDEADPNSEQIILQVAQPYANHNGGNLVFGPDGYLYIGLGDGGSAGDPQNNAQRPDSLLGKMLRIDVERGTQSGGATYTIPSDNPFINNSSYRPEIWATGLRNPWRYSFDRETKDLWIADVGQNRAEEVNFQPASSKGGENYGWRRTEGLECYPRGSMCDRTGVSAPILEYGRTLGQSVTGGFVYRGARYPDLRGFYLYGDFGSGNLWAVQRQGSAWDNRLVLATRTQISTFGEDEAGELYLADYRGDVYLISAGPPVSSTAGVVNAASFGPGLSPGSLGVIFGRGLTAFPGIVQAGVFPIPTELAGTSIKINGFAAPVIAVAAIGGQEQINFQAPYELSGVSTATLIITANGQASSPVEVPITSVQPEIFAISRNPAGITIWATAVGPVLNAPATGDRAPVSPMATVVSQPTVTIGGETTTVSFAGLAPGFAGLYQVNAALPAGIGSGAPVVVTAGGASSKPFNLP